MRGGSYAYAAAWSSPPALRRVKPAAWRRARGCAHSPPMPSPRRVVMLLVALAMLIGVVTPPVIEDHVEVGFCSADCPVQQAGHTTATAPPQPPSIARRSVAVVIAPVRLADA